MPDIAISLVAHTNVGKTTLARTLLKRDVGEVRDAPHVTEFADRHELIASPEGDRLLLWDTPGFGDSVRLARRLKLSANPILWFLAQTWDRWRDRAFWASQQALSHVKDESDLLLYLVNAGEPSAGWIEPEMQLLQWTGKPVLVLLNQLGAPRAVDQEGDELEAWRARMSRWFVVAGVLPLDAFARCWVHEEALLDAVQRALALRDADKGEAMARIARAWSRRNRATFDASIEALASSLARVATSSETIDEPRTIAGRIERWGGRLAERVSAAGSGAGRTADDSAAGAQQRLAASLDAQVRAGTERLLALHGLEGKVGPLILERVAGQFDERTRVPEGRAALLGGALTGALAGLKADIATGGLTLGGGMLAGGILGALGAAGVARGINVWRGSGDNRVAWSDDAMPAFVQAALLRYLAVIHFGRGRGQWVEGEAPAHWPQTVSAVLARREAEWRAAWQLRRSDAAWSTLRGDHGLPQDDPAPLALAIRPLLADAALGTLHALYPHAPSAVHQATDDARRAPACR